jgi:membrane protein CcdC involved in cytochrome C biogenesis
MDKQQLVEKATETLRPFETANLIDTIQHLTVRQVFSHPAVLILIIAIFFFGVVKRSKTVLLSLFSLLCIAVIMRYAMPAPGDDLSVSSMLPFIAGGLVIGGVVIYFSFIKSD